MTDAPTPPPPICYLDVETDGLHHGRQVYEIAIIRRDQTGEHTWHVFVQVPGFRISDPFGLKVGGFWDRHPQGRELTGKPPIPGPELVSRRAAALRVHQMLHDATVVGVNPTFDVNTLAALLRAEGLPAEPWNYHLEDLVAETVGYLRALEAHKPAPRALCEPTNDGIAATPAVTNRPWKSDALAAAVGVEPPTDEERHTALGDARWTQRWHQTLTGELR